MKKKVIIPGLLAAAAVVGLTSCDGDKTAPSVVDLEISGYTENFTVGDTFTKGDLKVEAKYNDDSKVDVSSDVKVDAPTSLSEPGTYAVIVSFGGVSEAYQIKVTSNSKVVAALKELTVSGAKDSFVVGDEFVTTGLKVEALYDDDTKADVTSTAKVSGPASLDKAGTYAVVVSYGGMNAVYQVNVAPKVLYYASVQEALEVGLANQSKVKSGTSKSRYSTYNPNVVDFEYGLDEYIKLTTYNGENVSFVEHFFPYEDAIIGIQSAPDWEDPTKFVDSKIGGASEFNLWGSNFYTFQNYEETVMDENDKELKPFGTVGILKYLYKLAQKDQEGYEEYITYTRGMVAYTFSFAVGSTDYSVTFMLDNSGAISNVYASANEYYLEIEQTVGTRDLVLDYDLDELIVKEFTLLDPKQSQPVEVVDGTYSFTMEIDELVSFGLKTNEGFKGDWLCDAVEIKGFDYQTMYSYYNEEENAVKFRAYCAGTYTITISTANCKLNVVVTVPQVAPDDMNAKPFYANEDNPNSAQFGSYITTPQKVSLDSNFYFVGAPVAFGKEANTDGSLYTVEIVSDNKEDATLELVNCDYADKTVSVYCFKAKAAGTYTILVKSTYEGCENITKTFDVEVIDVSNINVSNIFTGTYSYNDYSFDEKPVLTFTPASDGALTGSLSLTFVYFDYSIWNAVVVDAVYDYSVDSDTKAVTLTPVSGTDNITSFTLNLNDVYELQFSLMVGDININYANLQVEVVIPAAWIGTYMAPGEEGNFYLTITEDSITYSMGGSNTIKDFTLTGPNTFTMGEDFAKFTVSVDGDTVTITDDNWGDVYTAYTPVTPEPTLPASWVGTWVYTSPMGMPYTLVVTESSATYSAPGIIVSTYLLDGNTLTFELDSETVTLTFAEEDGVVTVTDNYGGVYVLDDGGSDVTPDPDIQASWIGTWVCNGGMYTLIVTEDSITYKDYSGTLTDYVINGNEVSLGGGYMIFTFAEENGVVTVTDNYDGVYELSGGDVTPDPDIQASWIGTWVCNGGMYTLIVTEGSITYKDYSGTLTDYVINGNEVSLGGGYMIFTFAEEDGVVTVTDNYDGVYVLDDGGSDVTPVLDIPASWVGTYVAVDSQNSTTTYTLVITADSIKHYWNDEDITESYISIDENTLTIGTGPYAFVFEVSVDDETGAVTFTDTLYNNVYIAVEDNE